MIKCPKTLRKAFLPERATALATRWCKDATRWPVSDEVAAVLVGSRCECVRTRTTSDLLGHSMLLLDLIVDSLGLERLLRGGGGMVVVAKGD